MGEYNALQEASNDSSLGEVVLNLALGVGAALVDARDRYRRWFRLLHLLGTLRLLLLLLCEVGMSVSLSGYSSDDGRKSSERLLFFLSAEQYRQDQH